MRYCIITIFWIFLDFSTNFRDIFLDNPFPLPYFPNGVRKKTPRGASNPGKRIYVKIPLKGWVPWASLPPPPKLALQGNAGHQVFITVFCQRIVVQPYRTRVLEQVECAGVGPRAENKVLVSAGGLWSGCFFPSPLFSLFHVKFSLLVVYDNTCS